MEVVKWVVIIYGPKEHELRVNAQLDTMILPLKRLKSEGRILNTWCSMFESSEAEWKRDTEKQAHQIALLEIMGKRLSIEDENRLSEDTKKRIEEAKQRIFRSMIP